jgi:hypothetical protein
MKQPGKSGGSFRAERYAKSTGHRRYLPEMVA